MTEISKSFCESVAPARERGLKSSIKRLCMPAVMSRSREGAWIEMGLRLLGGSTLPVAPARERGLKYFYRISRQKYAGRSREGAWIEIFAALTQPYASPVAPARERGLKYVVKILQQERLIVAPARERGLK